MKNIKFLLKRFMLVVVAVALMFTTLGLTQQVEASSYTYHNHYPGGKNYLDPNNMDYNWGMAYLENSIKVKSNTDYTMSIPAYAFEYGGELEIEFDSGHVINADAYGDMNWVGDVFTYTFNTGSETYLNIYMYGAELGNYIAYYGFYLFQLEEGTQATSFEEYIAPVVDSTPPLIDGAEGVWFTNVDNPHSVQDIKATLTAYDETDGDLTSSIVIEEDNYTGNQFTLGDYDVIFSVTDSSGNKATITITVRVVDIAEPVISLNGPSTVYVEVGTSYSEQGASVFDNYDINLQASISGTVNINQLGSYTITYTAVDSSGNEATPVTRTVIVRDTTAPEITLNGSSTIYVEFGQNYSELGATATDNFDSNVTVQISGSVNVGQLGTYTITYTAVDSSGNEATPVTRTVIVRDTTPPVINGPSTITKSNVQRPSLNSLLSEFDASDLHDGNLTSSITVVSDSYTGNEAVTGSYQVTIRVTDSSGNSTDKTFTIIIEDHMKPVFETTGRIVSKEYADQMTQEQIRDLLNNNN